MKPSDFYQELVNSITDDDIRRAARIMTMHVGYDNLITIDGLSERIFGEYTNSTERKTREILEKLTTEYHLPVCSLSGKSGRWLAANEDERISAVRELESRGQSILDRAKALRFATVPAQEILDKQPVQANLWGQL